MPNRAREEEVNRSNPVPPLRQRPLAGPGRPSIPKQTEHRWTTAAHYRHRSTVLFKEGPEPPQLRKASETRRLKVVPDVVGPEGAYSRCEPPNGRTRTGVVEPAVGVAGADGQARISRIGEENVEVRHARRAEPLAAPPRPGSPAREEEGDVRAQRQGGGRQRPAVADPVGAGQAAEHRRCVGASSSEAGRDRDALHHPYMTAVGDPESPPELLGGAGGEVRGPVQLGMAGTAAAHLSGAAGKHAHLDVVGEVERDHQALDLVVAVGARRPDPQDQVHLGGGSGGETEHGEGV